MSMEAARPAGYRSVTPRVVVSDVTAVAGFLHAVFGATGEVQEGRAAEIRVGDSMILVSAAGQREPFPAFLYVYVDDADAAFQRALAAGATALEEPLDTPYGDRRAMVRDPYGNVFQIACRTSAAPSGGQTGQE
jgi:PhnB protein